MITQTMSLLLAVGQVTPPPVEPPPNSVRAEDVTFVHEGSIAVPSNPHGICFDASGRRAYVACAGADSVAVVDLLTKTLIGEIPAGSGPLDVVRLPDSNELLVTQFGGSELVRIPDDPAAVADRDPEDVPRVHTRLERGPSLFTPGLIRGRRFLVCEHGDGVYELDRDGRTLRTWYTEPGPYPAAATADGILLFVPSSDSGQVQIIDTLNEHTHHRVAVGPRPRGGCLTADDVSYVVACSGSNQLMYVNTASFTVTDVIATDVGPAPFAVTPASDDRFGLVNNAGGRTVSVLDMRARRIVGAIDVGTSPIVVRSHPDGRRILVSCEGDDSLHVIRMTRHPQPEPQGVAPTEVIVLGMIHDRHRTSEHYTLEAVRQLLRVIGPDDVCAEIPPNRLAAAAAEFAASGRISEERVARFPEYTDALFPLQAELGFRIIPAAGWTNEIAIYRRSRLEQIRDDPLRQEQWAAHEAAMEAMNERIAALGDGDDPRVIHTEGYDDAVAAGYGGPYRRHFSADLADGGWDGINARHYRLVADHLDAVSGQGRRVLITFGAAHKGWFLEKLRRRSDVTLLPVGPFLDTLDEDDRD